MGEMDSDGPDGEVWAYEDMPDAAKTMWRTQGGNVRSIGYANVDGLDWTQTLTPVNVATPAPPAQPDRIAHAVSILATATEAELVTFARQLVAANAINADMAINALCDAYHDEASGGVVDSIVAAIMAATDTQRVDLATALAQRAPHMADALATVLRDAVYDVTVDDDDCRCLLAAAQ